MERINFKTIKCPYGNKNVEVIIRDSIEPDGNIFARGDVIENRLKAGPMLFGLCPLAMSINYEIPHKGYELIEKMKEYKCPNPGSKKNGFYKPGCIFSSGKWEMMENFLH